MIYSGQGPMYMGDFDLTHGTPAQGYLVNMKKIGCANRTLKFNFKQTTKNIRETDSGQHLTFATLESGKEAGASLEMVDFDRTMLAMAMYGTTALVPAGTVTNEAFPTVVAGDVVHTKHPIISTVVIKDSAATPVTLTLGTHYTVDSADHGRINIVDPATLTQPFKIDYDNAAYGNIAAFSATSVTKGIIFDGINTSDGSKVRVIVPRIKFSPTKDFDWLGDAEAVLALEGEILYVAELSTDNKYGPFFRIDALAS